MRRSVDLARAEDLSEENQRRGRPAVNEGRSNQIPASSDFPVRHGRRRRWHGGDAGEERQQRTADCGAWLLLPLLQNSVPQHWRHCWKLSIARGLRYDVCPPESVVGFLPARPLIPRRRARLRFGQAFRGLSPRLPVRWLVEALAPGLSAHDRSLASRGGRQFPDGVVLSPGSLPGVVPHSPVCRCRLFLAYWRSSSPTRAPGYGQARPSGHAQGLFRLYLSAPGVRRCQWLADRRFHVLGLASAWRLA